MDAGKAVGLDKLNFRRACLIHDTGSAYAKLEWFRPELHFS